MSLVKWIKGKFTKYCKCLEPRYEVIKNTLCCGECRLPINSETLKGVM